MSVASVLENEDPDQINQQSGYRDRKQPLMVNIRRLQSSLRDRQVSSVVIGFRLESALGSGKCWG